MESFLPPGAAQKRGIIEEECASPSRKRLMLDASTIDRPSMCDRCRNIQWEDLAAIPPASRRGRKAADLRPVDSDALRQSNCPTCRLFAEIIPPSLDGQHCRLVALSSSLAFQGQEVRATERVDGSDCTVLYPVLETKSADKTAGQRIQRDWYEGGCLALVNNSHNSQALPETGPRRISARLDTDMIKRWVRECVKRHRTCRPNVGGINDLQGFRVIDCDSRKTIEAPAGCRYVALSYVWGKPPSPEPPEKDGEHTKKDAGVPRVVIDAMEVTQTLGERYLWVDKLVSSSRTPAVATMATRVKFPFSPPRVSSALTKTTKS